MEQFYYPEGWGGAELPRDLTTHLSRSGLEVEVVCGSDRYSKVLDNSVEDPRKSGIRITRVPSLFKGDIHSWKALRQIWFYIAVAPLLFLRHRPALFILQTNPPLGVVLGAAAARFWRCPLIVIAMDVYPEVIIAHGALRADSWRAKLLDGIFRWAYRCATKVVVLGPVMAERIAKKGVDASRIVEIPNWSTGVAGVVRGPANRLLAEWNLGGRFVLLYSGNLGIGHEFDTLLEGFALAAKAIPALQLVVVGKGSRLAAARVTAERMNLGGRILFQDYLPADRLPESFGLAQLAIITLRPGFEGLIVPSKLYGYMSRGVPILYIGPRSDIELFVQRYGCGVIARNGEVQEVARLIMDLYGKRDLLEGLGESGRREYEAALDRSFALARYDVLVRTCLDTR